MAGSRGFVATPAGALVAAHVCGPRARRPRRGARCGSHVAEGRQEFGPGPQVAACPARRAARCGAERRGRGPRGAPSSPARDRRGGAGARFPAAAEVCGLRAPGFAPGVSGPPSSRALGFCPFPPSADRKGTFPGTLLSVFQLCPEVMDGPGGAALRDRADGPCWRRAGAFTVEEVAVPTANLIYLFLFSHNKTFIMKMCKH